MIFAVDGGGTTFKTCLVDEAGALHSREAFRLEPEKGVDALRRSVGEIFRRRHAESLTGGHAIHAIGVGCRGIIDPTRNMLLDDSGVMNFFAGHSFDELFETDLPIATQNDAVAAAMGENKFGIGREVKHFVLLTLGTGIGGGIIIDGRIYPRSTEMGHFPVNPEGDLCGCGNVGCIEREFSASAFRQRWASINERRPEEKRIRDVKHLFELSREGDKEAAAILKRGVFYLARGISGYANALDPECLVLSGGISQAGDYLKALLVEELKPILWRKDPEQFVQISRLGADMGLYGAGAVGAVKLDH